ncbi:MAG: efflux RND transporter periplasmic adaptor subunit [Litorivicinus sp.]
MSAWVALSANAMESESCLLQPSRTIELSSSVPGVVAEVRTSPGQTVERGEVLFRLEARPERAAMEVARARLEFAQRRIERNETLLSQNLLAAQEQDELETERALAELELKQARTLADLKSIRAPVTGTILALDVDVGEYVGAEPLARIVVLDPLEAKLVFSAEYLKAFAPGQVHRLQVQGSDQLLQGAVSFVDPVVDPTSGTFGVTVEVSNPLGEYTAGLRCGFQKTVPQ